MVQSIKFTKQNSSLNSIKDMNTLKYAMAIAVAGRHHMLAVGNTDKADTVLKHMPQLLPKLFDDEVPNLHRVYSLSDIPGTLHETRPFRMPHPTATLEGMLGGGPQLKPGEVSLADGGVLYLKDASDFRASVLQCLRIPLEIGDITISRAGRYTTFPAKFQLVMSAQPCPCGNYGTDKRCFCSNRTFSLYWKKFAAPVLDRLGIVVDCNATDCYSYLSLAELRDSIKQAWEAQLARGMFNEDMQYGERFLVTAQKMLDNYAWKHFSAYYENHDLSVRVAWEIIKVARTVQDTVDPSSKINDVSLCVALQLRDKRVIPI